ncbi:MAG: hypothetical protein MAG431_02300 [Chloroflexi bacterium]|nr:hypothetical protein [Chloroflexota bacterium]
MTHTTYSPTAIQLTQHAEQLFNPLVQQGLFDNFERALRTVLLKYVDEQILVYKKRFHSSRLNINNLLRILVIL